jgi:branched-chain amino acid transport system substrate-binding protein
VDDTVREDKGELTMRHRPSRPFAGRRLLLAVLAATLLVAGCGTSKDSGSGGSSSTTTKRGSGSTSGTAAPISGVPGVSDTSITFAALGTGPASDPLGGCNYQCYVEGVKAYFGWRNSHGGVQGRQLVLGDVVDDQLGNNQVQARQIIHDGKAFGVFSYPTIASGFADLSTAGVPLYTIVQFAPEVANQQSSFVMGGATCITCTSVLYSYAAKLAGAKRVASLGYSISPASKQCVAAQDASIKKYSKSSGVTVAYSNDGLAYGLPNGIAPEVSAIRDQHVDLILTCLDQRAVRTIEQELQRQGLDKVKILLPRAIGDPTLLQGAGSLFEGDLAFVLNRPYDAARAKGTQMADFLTSIKKSTVKDINLDVAVQGWIDADMAYQGLKAAPAQFDRAKVVAATNAIEDYTAGGLIAPMDIGRQHQPPTEADPVTHGGDPTCMIFAQVTNGKWKVLGDLAKPWSCWDPRDKATLTTPTRNDFR